MPGMIHDLDLAASALAELVDRAAAGEEILIVRGGEAIAHDRPSSGTERPRQIL